ncbi:DMT family transporter [[Mycobacterium] burgundiense]|uniref:DMT family transporter n=1 Tax=[Mycobacterium] burgundiense TaxID=3064286 RepID=A0ABN9NB99_9MYCO|nr:DMT family transporter [Mycolicibacterium sp. MU0053]CAJ1503408.1 DMT family transporter [Mycolicibacterium sp. MU0053]
MSQPIVVALALIAALCAALGIVVRQLATRDVPADAGMSSAIVTSLLRNPLWWAGLATAAAGYGFQAAALSFGSLMLVQPLLVSALLFALPISARLAGRRVTRTEWGWALVLTLALAVFVSVAHPRQGHNDPSVGTWIVVAAIVVPLVLGCVLLAAKAVGTQRALYLATAVGVLFGLIAVLTKLCTHRVQVGSWRTLLETPALYLLVVLAVVATVLQQSALHAGALPASVPAMLVLEPVAAVLLGTMVLGEQLTARGVGLVALPCALIAMAAATVALGRDSGALDERIAAHP